MTTYYKKTEYVEAITEHYAKEGKHMTNLKKAQLSQLHQIALDKCNIDMDLFVNIRKTELKVKARDAKAQKVKEAFEYQQREEAYQKEKQEEENKINDFKRTTHMDLNAIKHKWVIQEQVKYNQYFKDNKKEIEKQEKDADDFKKRMANSLNGEITEYGIKANGVYVDMIGIYKHKPTEKSLRGSYDERKMILMLSRLNIHEEVDYDSDESELVISDDSDDDECVTNPPYYCDGGCGKKVGDGKDHECKRVCDDC